MKETLKTAVLEALKDLNITIKKENE